MNHVKFFIWSGAICALVGGLWFLWNMKLYEYSITRLQDAIFVFICGILITLASIFFGIMEVVLGAIWRNWQDRQLYKGGNKH
jgi:membrane protein implicated in regulation of membrane protease activity